MIDNIEININDSFGIKSMKFNIYGYQDKIETNFKFLEKIHDSAVYNEQLNDIFDKIHENMENKKEIKKLISDLNELSKKHMEWKSFNIELNKITNEEYYLLLNNIKHYKYEKTKRSEEKRNSLYLDGINVSILTTIDSKRKSFQVKNPEKKLHPKLCVFLEKSLKMFTSKYEINPKKIIEF